MKIEKATQAYVPFKDQFKKKQQKKKQQQNKKVVEPPKEKKDSHFIGWA
jgi:hypothetical protein